MAISISEVFRFNHFFVGNPHTEYLRNNIFLTVMQNFAFRTANLAFFSELYRNFV